MEEKPVVRSSHTINKDCKAQEGEITLPFYGVPANVRITFSQKHRTALQTTSCQVCDHLQINNVVLMV